MNLKIFFTWWNRQTLGTFLKTLFFGKFVGKDDFGNKYYKIKKIFEDYNKFRNSFKDWSTVSDKIFYEL